MSALDIFKKFRVVKQVELNSMKKGLEDFKVLQNSLRPQDENDFFSLNRSQTWGTFDTRVNAFELYQLSIYSDILQNVLNTLRNEMFRNGFEYNNITTYDNNLQLTKLEGMIKRANLNNQTLIEVLMEFENDLNVIDDAYLFARKNYFVNAHNEIIGGKVQEIIRIDPLSIEMILDSTNRLGYNKEGQPVYFDPENRSQITTDQYNPNGIRNMNACYRVNSGRHKSGGKTGYLYYDNGEILHQSKYRPTKSYGFSPLYSLYNKVMTLINMDYYIKQYYSGNKVPKGMMVVNTSNASGFWKFWDSYIEKLRKNPHAITPLIHQSSDSKDPIKWIDFMRNLQEMQYTEVRNEIRTQIGAVYNVSPIFQNDVSTGGGLNNEGLQITVTDRGVAMGQRVYNDKVLPWLLEQLGITDYDLQLMPSREEDQIHEKELRLKDIEIARATAELGITVTMNETGDFSFSEGEVKLVDDGVNSGLFDIGKRYNMNKADKIPEKDIVAVENTLIKELEKLLSKFDTKTRPSKEVLDKKIKETIKDFDKIVQNKSTAELKKIYQKAMKDVGKELDTDFKMTDVDNNVIGALTKEPTYKDAFSGMSTDLSDKLKDVVTKVYSAPEGFTIDQLVSEMKESADAVESKLRTIARTETTKISVASRKVQYDKSGADFKYFHIGPNDNRTTPVSKEIKSLTKNGVSWDKYVDILTKVSKKHNPKWIVNKEAPITHPNTRHIFIAKRV